MMSIAVPDEYVLHTIGLYVATKNDAAIAQHITQTYNNDVNPRT